MGWLAGASHARLERLSKNMLCLGTFCDDNADCGTAFPSHLRRDFAHCDLGAGEHSWKWNVKA